MADDKTAPLQEPTRTFLANLHMTGFDASQCLWAAIQAADVEKLTKEPAEPDEDENIHS